MKELPQDQPMHAEQARSVICRAIQGQYGPNLSLYFPVLAWWLSHSHFELK